MLCTKTVERIANISENTENIGGCKKIKGYIIQSKKQVDNSRK